MARPLMYKKLSNKLKEAAFLLHKWVGIVFPCPVKCIPSPKHRELKLSRAINLTTCAHHVLVLFAPIQSCVDLVGGQMFPAMREEPILPLRALVLPSAWSRGKGTAMGNNHTDRLAVWSTLIPFILSFSLHSEWGEQLEQGQMGKCWLLYKHVAEAYGGMKLQNQSKENALHNHMSCPTLRKGWGELKVMLKHSPPPSEAPSAVRAWLWGPRSLNKGKFGILDVKFDGTNLSSEATGRVGRLLRCLLSISASLSTGEWLHVSWWERG